MSRCENIQTTPKTSRCRRKAFWLAFGLLALSTFSSVSVSASQNTGSELNSNTDSTQDQQPFIPGSTSGDVVDTSVDAQSTQKSVSNQQFDEASEAAKEYKKALHTLSKLTANLPSRPPSSFLSSHAQSVSDSSSSLLSTLLPNFMHAGRGAGPIANAIRIGVKLHHRLSNLLGAGPVGKRGKDKPSDDEMSEKSIKVLDLLTHSVELGSTDALFTLAHLSLFPPTPHFPSEPKLAFQSFDAHAQRTGNATSQAILAFFHATGYGGATVVDQAKAQLYYTFAANGGHKGAQQALGYRYLSGIGTVESCMSALDWYEHSAEQSYARYLSGPPGGRTLPRTATKLSDLVGGVYGIGASVASTGLNVNRAAIRAGLSQASGETWADILDYYVYNADRHEVDSAFRLGKIYYQGSVYAVPGGIASGSEGVAAIPRNFAIAHHYFSLIAGQVWKSPPPHKVAAIKDENAPTGYAAAAAGYLGRMYLRGEGVHVDYEKAKAWFDRGVEFAEKESHNALGIMWRDGLIPGKKADIKKAVYHFSVAAGQELAEAQVNLAKVNFERGDLALATTFFETAVRFGSPFEGYYYLGRIHSAQANAPHIPENLAGGSCAMAVSFFKHVSERGAWGQNLLKAAENDWMRETQWGREQAILKWWIAAERGEEIAQNNLGFVLDQDKSMLRLTRFAPMTPSNDTARLALTQWIRAAGQRNIDALVKVGDYYYHGLGLSDSSDSQSLRYEKAAKYYQSAADTQMSALAMWNLGWMYENGVGVPRDFHLAKRFYDLAYETNADAYIPVLLSLVKLYARSWWHTMRGGEGGLLFWGDDDQLPPVREKEQRPALADSNAVPGETDPPMYEEEDGPWYPGKAKEDLKRRQAAQALDGAEEDPIQWARDRRRAEQEDYGPEDYFEGALRGGHRENHGGVDEFSETMLLVLLCVAVSVLIYLRTRIVDRMRQRQRGPPAPPAAAANGNGAGNAGGNADGNGNRDGGLFPPPGDPARDEWAVLR